MQMNGVSPLGADEQRISNDIVQITQAALENIRDIYTLDIRATHSALQSLEAKVQEQLRRLKSLLSDLQYAAEEQETPEQVQRVAACVAHHQGEFDRVHKAFQDARVAYHRTKEQSYVQQRQELIGSPNFSQRQQKIASEQEALLGAQDVTASLRRTKQLMLQNMEQTHGNISVIGASNKRLQSAGDELTGQRDVFKESHGLLGALKRQAMVDRIAFWGGFVLFMLVVAYISFKRTPAFLKQPLYSLLHMKHGGQPFSHKDYAAVNIPPGTFLPTDKPWGAGDAAYPNEWAAWEASFAGVQAPPEGKGSMHDEWLKDIHEDGQQATDTEPWQRGPDGTLLPPRLQRLKQHEQQYEQKQQQPVMPQTPKQGTEQRSTDGHQCAPGDVACHAAAAAAPPEQAWGCSATDGACHAGADAAHGHDGEHDDDEHLYHGEVSSDYATWWPHPAQAHARHAAHQPPAALGIIDPDAVVTADLQDGLGVHGSSAAMDASAEEDADELAFLKQQQHTEETDQLLQQKQRAEQQAEGTEHLLQDHPPPSVSKFEQQKQQLAAQMAPMQAAGADAADMAQQQQHTSVEPTAASASVSSDAGAQSPTPAEQEQPAVHVAQDDAAFAQEHAASFTPEATVSPEQQSDEPVGVAGQDTAEAAVTTTSATDAPMPAEAEAHGLPLQPDTDDQTMPAAVEIETPAGFSEAAATSDVPAGSTHHVGDELAGSTEAEAAQQTAVPDEVHVAPPPAVDVPQQQQQQHVADVHQAGSGDGAAAGTTPSTPADQQQQQPEEMTKPPSDDAVQHQTLLQATEQQLPEQPYVGVDAQHQQVLDVSEVHVNNAEPTTVAAAAGVVDAQPTAAAEEQQGASQQQHLHDAVAGDTTDEAAVSRQLQAEQQEQQPLQDQQFSQHDAAQAAASGTEHVPETGMPPQQQLQHVPEMHAPEQEQDVSQMQQQPGSSTAALSEQDNASPAGPAASAANSEQAAETGVPSTEAVTADHSATTEQFTSPPAAAVDGDQQQDTATEPPAVQGINYDAATMPAPTDISEADGTAAAAAAPVASTIDTAAESPAAEQAGTAYEQGGVTAPQTPAAAVHEQGLVESLVATDETTAPQHAADTAAAATDAASLEANTPADEQQLLDGVQTVVLDDTTAATAQTSEPSTPETAHPTDAADTVQLVAEDADAVEPSTAAAAMQGLEAAAHEPAAHAPTIVQEVETPDSTDAANVRVLSSTSAVETAAAAAAAADIAVSTAGVTAGPTTEPAVNNADMVATEQPEQPQAVEPVTMLVAPPTEPAEALAAANTAAEDMAAAASELQAEAAEAGASQEVQPVSSVERVEAPGQQQQLVPDSAAVFPPVEDDFEATGAEKVQQALKAKGSIFVSRLLDRVKAAAQPRQGGSSILPGAAASVITMDIRPHEGVNHYFDQSYNEYDANTAGEADVLGGEDSASWVYSSESAVEDAEQTYGGVDDLDYYGERVMDAELLEHARMADVVREGTVQAAGQSHDGSSQEQPATSMEVTSGHSSTSDGSNAGSMDSDDISKLIAEEQAQAFTVMDMEDVGVHHYDEEQGGSTEQRQQGSSNVHPEL